MQKIERRANGTIRVCTVNEEPDMAQQQFKDECDVNRVIARFEKTGQITHLAKMEGRYVGLGESTDLMTALNRVRKAEEAFMSLPAELRAKCDHDPARFLDMINDPSKHEMLSDYGVIERPQKKVSIGSADSAASAAPVASATKQRFCVMRARAFYARARSGIRF